MSAIGTMLNIFIDPKEAVKGFDNKWAWLWPLLIISLVTAVVGWQMIPMTLQAMQRNPPNGLTSEQLQQALPRIKMISSFTIFLSPIMTGAMMAAWAGLLIAVGAVMDIRTTFLKLFTLVAHCGLINAVQSIAHVVTLRMKGDDIQSLQELVPHFGLDLFLSDGANKQLAALLGYFSIFQIWYLVILALGLAFLTGISKGKAFAAITPIWFLGLMMRIGGSFFG